jgi:hypothetical protein
LLGVKTQPEEVRQNCGAAISIAVPTNCRVNVLATTFTRPARRVLRLHGPLHDVSQRI